MRGQRLGSDGNHSNPDNRGSNRRALRTLQVIAKLSAPSRVSVNVTSRRKRPATPQLRPHPGVGELTTASGERGLFLCGYWTFLLRWGVENC